MIVIVADRKIDKVEMCIDRLKQAYQFWISFASGNVVEAVASANIEADGKFSAS
jgi:hypothetical protein